jgi:hypothetical protein
VTSGTTVAITDAQTLYAQWTATPTITLADTLVAVNTTYGTASATPTSFHVSGSNLTGAPGNLTVTPPTGYEVSLSSGAGYSTSLPVPYSSDTLASTQIYVRLAATAGVAGSPYSGNITVSGGGANSQTIATFSSTVAKATATVVVTPYTVDYDGSPHTATVTSITGVNGETGATVGTVTLNTTHTNAGTYNTDSWYLAGTANYNNIGTTTSSITVQNGSFETTGTALGGPWFMVGSPWSITSSPSNYQVIQAVPDTFTSTCTGGGTYIGLVNKDDCPITAPLVQNLNTSVSAGNTLSVTFYIGRAKNATGGAGVAYFDVAGTKHTMAFDTSTMTADTWQIQTLSWTVPEGVSGNLSLGFYGTSEHTINAWLDNVSNVSWTYGSNTQTITDTINKVTPTATLAVNNSPVTFDGTPHAATVGITSSSPAGGSVQNISTGGASTQTDPGTYAVTATYVPADTANYNTLTAQSAGNFVIAATPYSNWAYGTFTNAFTDKDPAHNPDADTLTNLQEYAFGTDPTTGDNGTITYTKEGLLTACGPPDPRDLSPGTGGVDYRAVFCRRKNWQAEGLTYTVQFSADLDFTPANSQTVTVAVGTATVLATDAADVMEAVSVPYPLFIPVTGGYKKPTFFRVGVTSN